MSKINVAIVDDHAILRSGLRLLINSQIDMHVVAEAANWMEAHQLAAQYHPDVMTVDLSMPGGDSFQQLTRLKQEYPRIKLIVLTMHEESAFFRASIAAGVDGYVLKKSADEELMTAIRNVISGRMHVSPELNSITFAAPTETASSSHLAALKLISPREREVIQFAAQGLTNREIADKLFLSIKTVESYRARSMTKLGLKTRADLVKFAVHHGMMPLDS